MPSPFPGMNPYLEQEDTWRDFRWCFIVAASQQLQSKLPPGFFARICHHEYYYGFSGWGNSDSPHPDTVVNTVPGDPLIVRLPPTTDYLRESYIEIRDLKTREAVAAVKLLSTSAKQPGPHREQYLVHRNKILRSDIHFMEIDLLRGGCRLPGHDAPNSDYTVLVSRWQQRPSAYVWPLQLRQPLPTITMPLSDGVPDVQLDLQAVVNCVCQSSRYELWIYESSPEPPLSPEDAKWARQFIPERI